MKHHTLLLTLSPEGKPPGSWTLARIGATAAERVKTLGTEFDKEIHELEEQLKQVDSWEKRVKELDKMLKVQELADDD